MKLFLNRRQVVVLDGVLKCLVLNIPETQQNELDAINSFSPWNKELKKLLQETAFECVLPTTHTKYSTYMANASYRPNKPQY